MHCILPLTLTQTLDPYPYPTHRPKPNLHHSDIILPVAAAAGQHGQHGQHGWTGGPHGAGGGAAGGKREGAAGNSGRHRVVRQQAPVWRCCGRLPRSICPCGGADVFTDESQHRGSGCAGLRCEYYFDIGNRLWFGGGDTRVTPTWQINHSPGVAELDAACAPSCCISPKASTCDNK